MLRGYQKQASDAAVRCFKEGTWNGLMVLPTAAGKSLVIADIASRLDTPLLVFQPTREILMQNYEKIVKAGMRDVGIYSASLGEKNIRKITLATIGSVHNHMDDFRLFKYVIVDECFPYKQYISTEWGQIKIGTLYNNYCKGKELPCVLSYNENTKECEPKKILSVQRTGVRKTITLHFSGCIDVKTTHNHPFLTMEGWKSAVSLEEGDAILTTSPTFQKFSKIPNQDQIDLILGSIIGDGSIDKGRTKKNLNRFRFSQGVKQIDYLKWKADMFDSESSIYSGKSGFCNNSVYFFNTPVLYYKDCMCSKKYAIEHLTSKSLAVIWMDDGHKEDLENGGTICAVAESEELTKLFADKLNDLGINCKSSSATSSYSNKIYHYIHLRKDGLHALCKLVAPFVHKSMAWKLTKETVHLAGSYVWNKTFSKFGCVLLQSKENTNNELVYNMEIEDNHTYILTPGRHKKDVKTFTDGLIVHNCHRVNSEEGMYKDYLTSREDRVIIGLTATPFRLFSFMGIGKLTFLTRTNPRIYDKVIHVTQIADMMAAGYLAKPEYYDMTDRMNFDIRRVKLNTTGLDFDEESLREEYNRSSFAQQLLVCTKMVLQPNDGSQRNGVIVFTRFVREAEVLTQGLLAMGISAKTISAKTPADERRQAVNDFKNGRIKVFANAGCLDTKTEILTREGWVGIDSITGDEHIAQYEDGIITFVKPNAIIKNEGYSDDFVSVKGQYMNIRVTKDHRMLYTSRHLSKSGREFVTYADSLVGKRTFLPISGCAQEEKFVMPETVLPCSKRRFINYNAYNYRKKGISYEEAERMAEELYNRRLSENVKSPEELTLDDCRFIGFFICDGNISEAKKGGKKSGIKYTFVQSLVNPHMCEWIENLLDRCGISFSYQVRKPSTNVIMGKERNVSDYKTYYLSLGTGGDKQYNKSNLHKLLPYLNKRGCDLFWGLNRKQFWALTEGMFKANGHHGDNKDYYGENFLINNKPLADLIQAIGVCRGYRIMVSDVKRKGAQILYKVSVGDYRYHELVNERLKYESHDKKERTWCVSVPTGKIVTRRNGRVTIVGNCLTEGFDYPALDTVIIASPTRSLNRWMQMLGRVVRPYDGKTSWVVDISGNYKVYGRIEDLRIENPSGGNQWMVTSRGRELTGILN